MKFDKPFQLYHLSEKNLDGKTLYPRPMDRDRVMEGENWKSPRICVSDSIDGAVSALADSMSNFTGLRFYVHVPIDLEELFKKNKVYKPSIKQVPDAETTGEHWLKTSVTFKQIGQIEIIGIDEDSRLTYLWDGEETVMDRFKWKWISRH